MLLQCALTTFYPPRAPACNCSRPANYLLEDGYGAVIAIDAS